MPTISRRSPKSKVTLTLDANLVRKIDALTLSTKKSSRSQIVEEALRRLLNDQAREEIDQQTEEYYRSLSRVEIKEDQKWSKIAARSAKNLWDK